MNDKIDEASNNGKQQFNQSSNPQPEKQGIGSEQVNNTKPVPPQPKPPGIAYQEQARISHQKEMEKDGNKANKTNDNALKLYEAGKARQEQQNQVELRKDNDREK